jgi:hypothetical protein
VERVEQLGGEADRLRQSVADLELERGRLAAEVEGAAAARARLEQALEQGLAEARAREQELEARVAAREQETEARLAAREQELEASVREREEALAALAPEAVVAAPDEAAAAAAPTEAATPESGDVDAADAELKAALAALAADVPTSEKKFTPPASAPSTAQPSTPAAGAPPSTPAPKPAAGAPVRAASATDDSLTVVLDANPRWEASADAKQKVAVVALNADTASRVTELRPSRIVVNLTNPKSLSTLVALREAGARARFWGCVADATKGRGVMLGVVEPVARPLDPNAILALLEQYGRGSRRVLTMGDDVDAFISLRQALTRGGMSVSMAWNGKQAVDLMPMVRPHLLVLDLGVTAGDVAPVLGLIAATASQSITALMPGPKDPAPTFAKLLEGAGSPASLPELLGQLRDPAMA